MSDCAIELALRNKYGLEAYFLTALGGVFDFSEVDYTTALDYFINQEKIAEFIIVNDTHCTFIQNTIVKKNNYHTKAELELRKLQHNNSENFGLLDMDQ